MKVGLMFLALLSGSSTALAGPGGGHVVTHGGGGGHVVTEVGGGIVVQS